MASIYRTSKLQWQTYWGDGNGRDGYIVMDNGGLNELRDYKGVGYNGWKAAKQPMHHAAAPRKEATAFDYKPDGSGRDSYVIFNYGLKRNYRSQFQDYAKSLRADVNTPIMNQRQMLKRNPFQTDATMFNNWPSHQQIVQNIKNSSIIRNSIERLSQSPSRNSPRAVQTPAESRIQQALNNIRKPRLSTEPVFYQRNQVTDTKAQTINVSFFNTGDIKQRKVRTRKASMQVSRTKLEDALVTQVSVKHKLIAGQDRNMLSDLQSLGTNPTMGPNQSELGKPSLDVKGISGIMESVNFNQAQLSDRRKMLKTELGRARAAPFQSHKVENLEQLNFNTTDSKNQSLKEYMVQEMAKTQTNQQAGNKPIAFITTHPKRLNIGHNGALDDLNGDKIVNNKPSYFYRAKTPLNNAVRTIDPGQIVE